MTKRICYLGILSALCLVLSYLESLVALSFIAPGIKLGLANTAALLLICKKDPRGALEVNLVRILLSALLFGTAMSLGFSLAGALVSFCVMFVLSKFDSVSVIGFSISGGVAHNVAQCLVAAFVIGPSLFYYLPLLILFGGISGALIGIVGQQLDKRLPEKYLIAPPPVRFTLWTDFCTAVKERLDEIKTERLAAAAKRDAKKTAEQQHDDSAENF